MSELDKAELEKIGVWHEGQWKGKNASLWRITDEAVEIMNHALINETNAVVGENDVLIHCGDFGCKPKSASKLEAYYRGLRDIRRQIKCQNIILIFGNHDDVCISDLFSETYKLHEILIHNQYMVLCHYAMAIWHRSHRKSWHLFGHSHSEAESWLDKMMPSRRSLDVGVDNAAKLLGKYRPFSFWEIKSIMDNKHGHMIGDHHIDPDTPSEDNLIEDE